MEDRTYASKTLQSLASSGASRPIAAAKLVMMGEPFPNTLATTPITPAAPASFASTT